MIALFIQDVLELFIRAIEADSFYDTLVVFHVLLDNVLTRLLRSNVIQSQLYIPRHDFIDRVYLF